MNELDYFVVCSAKELIDQYECIADVTPVAVFKTEVEAQNYIVKLHSEYVAMYDTLVANGKRDSWSITMYKNLATNEIYHYDSRKSGKDTFIKEEWEE